MVKGFLERLDGGGAGMDPGEYPTKANGYYTRDLLTLYSLVEDPRVPGSGKGFPASDPA